MTLAQPHALLNRNGHIFPVSHCGLRILLKNRGFPPPSLQAAFQQDSIQKPLFSTPLSIHSIHFIQFIQFTFISTSYEGIFTCSGRPRVTRKMQRRRCDSPKNLQKVHPLSHDAAFYNQKVIICTTCRPSKQCFSIHSNSGAVKL